MTLFTITKQEVLDFKNEYYFYTVGNSGSFTTSLLDAFRQADTGNFLRLSKAYPVHGFYTALHQHKHFLKHFDVEELGYE